MSTRFDTLLDWMKAAVPPLGHSDVPVLVRRTLERMAGARTLPPAHDVYETETELCIVLDVPGATPRNTLVSWDGTDTLTVHVARARPSLEAPRVAEYAIGDWYRVIRVPVDVDGARATTSLVDGVLTVRLPRVDPDGVEPVPVVVG